MKNVLKVVESFANLEAGDLLTLSKDGENYEFSSVDEYGTDDEDGKFIGTFSRSVTLPAYQARALIADGILQEMPDPKSSENNSKFVNIFDEIDNLLNQYNTKLSEIDEVYKDQPECLKVEATTVLKNMIKLLVHLKNLKK